MRNLFLGATLLFVWTLPVYAQPFPIPIRFAALCCQYGKSYGATTPAEAPSCTETSIFELEECTSSGGRLVAGSCHSDEGVCGGSTICCEGVTIGAACATENAGGHVIATPTTCAPATDDACNALSASGTQATVSVPGRTCSDGVCGPGGF